MIPGNHDCTGYIKYWGKASGSEGSRTWHPLAFHNLDVAAVGQVLLDRDPARVRQLSQVAELPPEDLVSTLVAFLALHDVGKFSIGFQGLLPDLLEHLHRGLRPIPAYGGPSGRHDALGRLLLRELRVTELIASGASYDTWEALESWFTAIAGHHGAPVADPPVVFFEHFPDDVVRDARDFVEAVVRLLLPEGFLLGQRDLYDFEEQFLASSWLVAGSSCSPRAWG